MTTAISTFFLVQQINRLVVQRADEALKKEGMTARQFLMLDMLASHEPCSSAELARRAHMTAQAMGEALKNLLQAGWLERTSSEQDGRTLLVQRTEAGRQLFIRCNKLIRETEADLFSCVSPSDMARVRGSLSLVREVEIARRGGES
jgi:DNA-binding MarR family transcriptional regulator